jgi:hypothetical protein
MIWFKRVLVGLLTAVLLLSLISLAFAVSARETLANPNKVSGWLDQSGLYGYINNQIINQAQRAISNSAQSSQLNPVISSNINLVLPDTTLNKDINSIVVNNYAWLEGKSSTPDFMIDLTGAKQSFATNMGAYVQTRLVGLPQCSISQSLQAAQTNNPYALTCRPIGVDPASIGAQVTSQIESSGTLLGNPVITASTISPNNDNTGVPYYQKFSKAPTIYQWSLRSSWLIGLLSVICALCTVFLSPHKRKGVRKIGVALLLSGLYLLIIKFASDALTRDVDHYISGSSSLGSLQYIVVGFINRVETAVVKVDYWFAILYLLLALLIFVSLFVLHKRSSKVLSHKPELDSSMKNGGGLTQDNLHPELDSLDLEPSSNSEEKTTTAPILKKQQPAKRRLIQ